MPPTTKWQWMYDGKHIQDITLGSKGGIYWGYHGGWRGRWKYWWNQEFDEHTYILEFNTSKSWSYKKHILTSGDNKTAKLEATHPLYEAQNLWYDSSIMNFNEDGKVQMVRISEVDEDGKVQMVRISEVDPDGMCAAARPPESHVGIQPQPRA